MVYNGLKYQIICLKRVIIMRVITFIDAEVVHGRFLYNDYIIILIGFVFDLSDL